jgi:hypothetical protein
MDQAYVQVEEVEKWKSGKSGKSENGEVVKSLSGTQADYIAECANVIVVRIWHLLSPDAIRQLQDLSSMGLRSSLCS